MWPDAVSFESCLTAALPSERTGRRDPEVLGHLLDDSQGKADAGERQFAVCRTMCEGRVVETASCVDSAGTGQEIEGTTEGGSSQLVIGQRETDFIHAAQRLQGVEHHRAIDRTYGRPLDLDGVAGEETEIPVGVASEIDPQPDRPLGNRRRPDPPSGSGFPSAWRRRPGFPNAGWPGVATKVTATRVAALSAPGLMPDKGSKTPKAPAVPRAAR
jgi:hypothetical protein